MGGSRSVSLGYGRRDVLCVGERMKTWQRSENDTRLYIYNENDIYVLNWFLPMPHSLP
jgi:hypothetical protein